MKNFVCCLLFLTYALTAGTAFAADYNVDIDGLTTVTAVSDAIQNTLTGKLSGDTVSVTGTANNIDGVILLDIPAGVTVRWRANLSGSSIGILINLSGTGVFEVLSGNIANTNSSGTCTTIYGGIVNIAGGTVSSTGSGGETINADTVTVSGGSVNGNAGQAIYANTVTITGGTVSSIGTGPVATVDALNVNVSGGTVSATFGHAISASTVTINGGTVFAYGSKISAIALPDKDAVIYGAYSLNTPSGNGVVLAWDETASGASTPPYTYNAGEEDDIIKDPGSTTATWDSNGITRKGIRYRNGTNQGFIDIVGVTFALTPTSGGGGGCNAIGSIWLCIAALFLFPPTKLHK